MISIYNRIQSLRKKLNKWQYAYHTENESPVSDEEYDAILEELQNLELSHPNFNTYDSPTYNIGSIPQSGFNKIYHHTPMLSLHSISSKSQLLLFDKKVKNKLNNNVYNVRYCCELKLDGVAINLVYKFGKLVQASTRGDGKIGEDVTKNAYTIDSIPMHLKSHDCYKLPYLLEVRGEVFILKSCFVHLNEIMLRKKNKLFSNSRNAASGSLRQLDHKITASRPLSFCCFGISYYLGQIALPNSHWDRLQLCRDWGITISDNIRLVDNIYDALKFYDHIREVRTTLKVNIDGIVIKVDNCFDQNKLSYNMKAPNWAIAYKFPTNSQSTKLNKVVFQVGRTGLITPIACIDPVVIDNVYIKKVNMHNINEMKRLNLKIGDTVFITRSGEVIPKILKVISIDDNNTNIKPIEIPKFCPVCGAVLKFRKNNSFLLYCTAQSTCLAQRKAILQHFVSRKAMNIRGIGKKLIDQLFNKKLVLTPVDFFYLNKEKLLHLNRYGIKSVERLLRSIEESKSVTLSRFIYALSIPNVGETVAYNLAIIYKNINNLMVADFNTLSNLQNIGPVIALDIYNFFRNFDNLKNIQNLIHPKIGIKWVVQDSNLRPID